MADRYNHYGIEVLRQYVDSFRGSLKRQGVEYIDLAIAPDIDVITYDTVKGKRYAYIIQLGGDDYSERVYVTGQTPDDCDWKRLAEDIDAQCNGAEAMPRKTRAKMLLNAAQEIYFANLPESENVFNSLVGEPYDEQDMIADVQVTFAGWGIGREEIAEMEHYDIEPEFWNKLCEKKKKYSNIEVQSKE